MSGPPDQESHFLPRAHALAGVPDACAHLYSPDQGERSALRRFGQRLNEDWRLEPALRRKHWAAAVRGYLCVLDEAQSAT